MNKMGTIETIFVIIASIIIICSLIIGSYFLTEKKITANTPNEIYIGDKETQKVYDYRCSSLINEENKIVLNSLIEIKNSGYVYESKCPK